MHEELIRTIAQSDISGTFVQEQVDKIITELITREYPLRANIPRRKGVGEQWILVRRASPTTLAVFVDDVEDLVDIEGEYTRVTFPYRTIATRGKVTRRAQAVGQSLADLLAFEMEAKARDFQEKEEHALFWGQSVANDPVSGIGGPKEFDGLNKLCEDNQTVKLGDAYEGADLTTEALDQAIDMIRGRPSAILCSYVGRRKINALLQATQQFVNVTEVRGGFRVLAYNDIPIFVTTQIPDTLEYDGTKISALTATTPTTAIYVVSFDHLFIGELTPLTVLPLAKKSSQYDEFDIFEDITLVLRDPAGVSRIIGIKV